MHCGKVEVRINMITNNNTNNDNYIIKTLNIFFADRDGI